MDTSIDPEFSIPSEVEKHYTYNVRNLNSNSVDQMRFELGDTSIDGKDKTSALCDEEYAAMIEKAFNIDNKGWKWAKFLCLEAIMMRLSYEVDYQTDSISFSLSQRYKNWKQMYDEEKKLNKSTIPSFNLGANNINSNAYFKLGMQRNPRGCENQ